MMFLASSARARSTSVLRTSTAGTLRRHGPFSFRSISKLVGSAQEALADLDLRGATVAVGGFGLGGNPETLLQELAKAPRASELTVASLTGGVDGKGIGLLLEANKVKRLISSYVGENKFLEQAYFGGQLEVELTPQGTIAARLHAAGAGMPAFYTPTGAGTIYANGGIPIKYQEGKKGEIEIMSEPRETRVFDGTEYVLEHALKTDLALVKAYKADTEGNLVFRGTSRNANPECAMSGKMCVVEAEHIVQPGELHPDEINLPGIYVNRVIPAAINDKPIERMRLQDPNNKQGVIKGGRGRIMRRAAKEFRNGMYCNLGIGMYTTKLILLQSVGSINSSFFNATECANRLWLGCFLITLSLSTRSPNTLLQLHSRGCHH
jgi:3-oxoacid CoA-transferase